MLLIETQCLPPLSFFCEAIRQGGVLLEKYENYQKRSFRNRIYMAGPQGKTLFSIPLVKGKNEQQLITDVRLAYHTSWQDRFCKIVRSFYGSAPYFHFYSDGLFELIAQKESFLFDFNWKLLQWLIRTLQLEIDIEFTSDYIIEYPDPIRDLRHQMLPTNPELHTRDTVIYPQVFSDRHGFIPNLSTIDILFCMGPEAKQILASAAKESFIQK